MRVRTVNEFTVIVGYFVGLLLGSLIGFAVWGVMYEEVTRNGPTAANEITESSNE